MLLRADMQLASIIKAMKEVIIPAVDGQNSLAIQQAQLIVGLLNLMAHQLPVQFLFDRDELRRLIACAQNLSEVSTNDPAIGEAMKQLAAGRAAAAAVLEHCTADPANLLAAVRDMREATSVLMSAAASGSDKEALGKVERIILDMSREQILRERSLLLSQGFEPDPAAIPPIETLLSSGAGSA